MTKDAAVNLTRTAVNAALLVVEMLAITDAGLAAQLADHRREIAG